MAKATCKIEGCEKPVSARGWCAMHWKRWRTHGDPLVTLYGQPKAACSIEECDSPAVGHGWCSLHWQRWKRHGDPLFITRRAPGRYGEVCSVEGCGKPEKSLGWCAMHYSRWQEHGSLDLPVRLPKPKPPCSIDGCDEPSDARGWCDMHYQRWRNNGDPLITQISEITITCWEPGCERRLAKAGVCWTHHRSYKALFGAIQKHRCAICGNHEKDVPRKKLLLDHDHETGKPRALLCMNCNTGLGHFKDDVALLRAAIVYLRRTGSAKPARNVRQLRPELRPAAGDALW